MSAIYIVQAKLHGYENIFLYIKMQLAIGPCVIVALWNALPQKNQVKLIVNAI